MALSLFSGVTNWDELGAQMVAISGDGMLEPQVRVRRINQMVDKGVPVDFEDPDGVTALLASSVDGLMVGTTMRSSVTTRASIAMLWDPRKDDVMDQGLGKKAHMLQQ